MDYKFQEDVGFVYSKIKKIYCPTLGTDVFFDNSGLHHFFHRGISRGSYPRKNKQILRRINLLPDAIKTLRDAESFRVSQEKFLCPGEVFHIIRRRGVEVVVFEKSIDDVRRAVFVSVRPF